MHSNISYTNVIHIAHDKISKLHFQEAIWMVPPFPQAPHPQWITFLPISQKILLNIKAVEFDFRIGLYTCLISIFMNNKHAMSKFQIFLIFNFLIFKISDIVVLRSKITIFIIEISLKPHLHTKYWMK